MKNKFKFFAMSLGLFASLGSSMLTAFAQGTAFSYQGQLQINGAPANGSYDLELTLFISNLLFVHSKLTIYQQLCF